MHLNKEDYLKKALLDTQERVRDFMSYADRIEDKKLQSFFREYAESEGYKASELQSFIRDLNS